MKKNTPHSLHKHNTPRRRLFAPSLLFTSLLLSGLASAQELSVPCDELEEKVKANTSDDEVKRITAFQPAKTLKRINPEYPVEAARRGQEGWVKMSYVIDEDGHVQDPVVDDFSGNRAFKRKALNAIKRWTFEPAMKNGKPTQQCHQAVQFDFLMGGKPGATRDFIRAYKDVDAIYQQRKYAEANAALKDLHNQDNLNRYENAWLWNMDALIASGLEDWQRELNSFARMLPSNRSVDGKHSVFSDNHIAFVHQRMVILASKLGLYADAQTYYERLQEMDNQQERLSEITPLIAKVREHIDSDSAIQVEVTIDERGNWFHTLVRNQFAFDGIEGKLDTVEVRCESHRERFTVAENHIWNIPESWGQCRVLVEGQENAAFNLIEVAQSTSS